MADNLYKNNAENCAIDPFSVTNIGGDSILGMQDTSAIDRSQIQPPQHQQHYQQHPQQQSHQGGLPSPPPNGQQKNFRGVSPQPSVVHQQQQQQQQPAMMTMMHTPAPAVQNHNQQQMHQQNNGLTPFSSNPNFGQQQLFAHQPSVPPAPHNTPATTGIAPTPFFHPLISNNNNSTVNHNTSNISAVGSSAAPSTSSSPTAAEKIESLRRQLAEAQRNAFWMQSEAESLRRAGADQQRRIQQLEGERGGLAADLGDLRAAKQALEQQLEKTTAGAHTVVEQWRRRADECEESARAKERRAAELAGKLEAAESRIRELQTACSRQQALEGEAKLERALRLQMEQEREILQLRVDGFEKGSSATASTIASMQTTIETLRKDLHGKSTQLSAAEEEARGLQRDVARLRTEMEQWRSSCTDTQTQQERLREELNTALLAKAATELTVEKGTAAARQLQAALDSERAALADAVKSLAASEASLTETAGKLRAEQREVSTARGTISELTLLLSEAQSKERKYISEAEEARIILDDLTSTNVELKQSVAALEQTRQSLTSALEKETRELGGALAEYRKRAEELTAALKEAMGRASDAEMRCEDIALKLRQTEDAVRDLRDNLDEERDTQLTLNKVVSDLQAQYDGSQASMAELDAELTSTLQSRASVQSRLDAMTAEAAVAKEQAQRLEHDLRELRMEAERTKSQHALALSEEQKKSAATAQEREAMLEETLRRRERAAQAAEEGQRAQLDAALAKAAAEKKLRAELEDAAERMKIAIIAGEAKQRETEQRVRDLEQQLHAARADLAAAEHEQLGERDRAAAQLKALETEAADSGRRAGQAEALAATLRGDRDEGRAKLGRVEAALTVAETERTQGQRALRDMKERVFSLESSLEAKALELEATKQALHKEKEARMALVMQKEEQEGTMMLIPGGAGQQQQQHRNSGSTEEIMRTRFEELSRRHEELSQTLAAAQREQRATEQELEEVKQSKEDAETSLFAELRRVSDELAAAIEQRDAMHARAEQLMQSRDDGGALRTAQADVQQLRSENKLLLSRLSMADAVMEQLRSQAKNREVDSEATTARIADMQRSLRAAEQGARDLEVQLLEKRRELDTAERRANEASAAATSLAKKLEAAQQELATEQNKRRDLKDVMEKYNMKFTQQVQIVNDMQRERDEVVADRDAAVSKYNSVAEQLRVARSALHNNSSTSALQGQIDKLQRNYDQLVETCKRQRIHLDSSARSAAAMQAMFSQQQVTSSSSSSASPAFGMFPGPIINNSNSNNHNMSSSALASRTSMNLSASLGGSANNSKNNSRNISPMKELVNFTEGERRKPQKRLAPNNVGGGSDAIMVGHSATDSAASGMHLPGVDAAPAYLKITRQE